MSRSIPVRSLPGRPARKRPGGPARLRLEHLEDRTLPSVNVSTTFLGIDINSSNCNCQPPDTIAAAGPNNVVELVNLAMRVSDKSGNTLSTTSLATFFSSLSPASLSDPVVFFDEGVTNPSGAAGRWVVGVLDFDNAGHSNFDFAVSNDADATHGFTEKHKVDMSEGGVEFADYPRFGYNADGYFFTFNQFNNATNAFDHVRLLTVQKSTVLDAANGTFTSFQANAPSFNDFTLAPALMHGAPAGGPMYLTESANFSGSGSTITIEKMTNYFSASPTFATSNVSVNSYSTPPNAVQPGGSPNIATNDSRVLQAAWRNNQLWAAHTIGVGTRALARWYEFNTSGTTPTLLQQGNVDPGAGINTYFPAIDVAPNGSVGLAYTESSSTEFASVYVTGRTSSDAAGTMEAEALVRAGNAHYTGSRWGDFSGLSVDPTDGSFWGAGELKLSTAYWSTAVGHFSLSQPVPPAGPAVISSTPTGTLNAASVSSISFTFNTAMDTTSFSPSADVGSFTGPGGVNLAGQITGFSWSANATTLTVNFTAQTTAGGYSMTIGPNINDASGHPMDQNGNGTAGESTDTYADSFTLNTPGTSRIIEDFEPANELSLYHSTRTPVTATIAAAAAHDGTNGLNDATGEDWVYRTDSAVTVNKGDAVSVWVQSHGAADGRAYFGFGASSTGTLSAVLAPNTGQLIIQKNVNYGFQNVAAVAQTYQANHWYRLEVDWSSTGDVTARLFDSDGITQLKSVTATAAALNTTITSGGIAFRAGSPSGNVKYWDTVTLVPGGGGINQGPGASGPVDSPAPQPVPPPEPAPRPVEDDRGPSPIGDSGNGGSGGAPRVGAAVAARAASTSLLTGQAVPAAQFGAASAGREQTFSLFSVLDSRLSDAYFIELASLTGAR